MSFSPPEILKASIAKFQQEYDEIMKQNRNKLQEVVVNIANKNNEKGQT